MRTGHEGIVLIKSFEGCELQAYQDAVGVWTIGYGHTSAAGEPHVVAGMTIDQAEAEEMLRRDLVKYESAVEQSITVLLNPNQFDALVSFCYNVGPGNLAKSTLRRKLNAGDFDCVPRQLLRWNKAGKRVLRGLTRRRSAEGALWSTPPAGVPEFEPITAPIEEHTEKHTAKSTTGWTATGVGAVATVSVASEQIQKAADSVSGIGQSVRSVSRVLSDFWPLMLLAIVGGVFYIWLERRKKSRDHGV